MSKRFAILLAVLALCLPVGALAAREPGYTLPTKGLTVLQNEADRALTPAVLPARRAQTPGESPVTGLPWQGTYRPMLVQISNNYGKVRLAGGTVKTAGVGVVAPWGLQSADILYETLMANAGSTRFTALFCDSFAMGEPAGGVGPVRSIRASALYLRAEWQATLVHSGGFGGMFGWRDQQTPILLNQSDANRPGAMVNLLRNPYRAFCYRVQGVKAPANLNVDLLALQTQIPADFLTQPHAYRFAAQSPYQQGYAPAATVHLDWGVPETIAHFTYDAAQNAYLRYCGPGRKAAKWTLFGCYPSVENRDAGALIPLAFTNVILQRVAISAADDLTAPTQLVGQGNADIFIGGRYIPGYWVRRAITEPTVFLDDRGEELTLCPGKTYIAQLPVAALCAVEAGE